MNEQQIDGLARMVRDYLEGERYDMKLIKMFSELDVETADGFLFLKALKREINDPEVIGRSGK